MAVKVLLGVAFGGGGVIGSPGTGEKVTLDAVLEQLTKIVIINNSTKRILGKSGR